MSSVTIGGITIRHKDKAKVNDIVKEGDEMVVVSYDGTIVKEFIAHPVSLSIHPHT